MLFRSNKEEAENTGKRLLDDPDLVEAANKKKKKVQTEGVNPDMLEYGEKEAEVTEFYITDNKGVRATAVMKNEEFAIHMKVKFHQDIAAPIFAFSFKNIRGTEITGTNTMFEKAYLEASKVGEQKEIIFTQKMTLQGGEYLLSFGVTGYEGSNFKVYHRLYDAMNVTVISDKNTVGFYDMCSMVTVKDIS